MTFELNLSYFLGMCPHPFYTVTGIVLLWFKPQECWQYWSSLG